MGESDKLIKNAKLLYKINARVVADWSGKQLYHRGTVVGFNPISNKVQIDKLTAIELREFSKIGIYRIFDPN